MAGLRPPNPGISTLQPVVNSSVAVLTGNGTFGDGSSGLTNFGCCSTHKGELALLISCEEEVKLAKPLLV